MITLLPPASIRRCSARSRSFLLGPAGPAGAAPGQRLRSGTSMDQGEDGENKIRLNRLSTLSGEPRYAHIADLGALFRMATAPRRATQICRLYTSQKIGARRCASRAREARERSQGRGDAVWVGAGNVGHGAEDVPVARAPAKDAGQLNGEFFLRYLGLWVSRSEA